MAYTIKRGSRFTGYYRDRNGHRHSAGTYATQEEALVQAQSVEASGIIGGLQSHLTLHAYIDKWLPTADLLPLTKKNYESVLRTHVLPLLGRKKVSDISRANIREMLETLRQRGIGSSTRTQAKSALGSALGDLVDLDQLSINPTHGVKVKLIETNALRNVLEPTEFKSILQHLPTPPAQLFAQFLVLSGCRFGEATELRVSDLNVKSSEVYVQRRVNDLGARLNEGSRFRVLESTKSGHSRVVVLTRDLTDALVTHIESNTLGKNDLLFSKALVVAQDSQPSEADGTPDLFVADGREYAHGTVYAYTHGKCRCPECRNTMRRYRHKERGLKTVRKERVVLNVSGHLPRDTWRRIWKEAIEASGLEWSPRTHDLRHANATLLLKNGVDLHEVKERLGHQSIRTTERYLHRIKAQQSKASDAVSEFL